MLQFQLNKRQKQELTKLKERAGARSYLATNDVGSISSDIENI
jgi:hypothetical protein